MNKEKNLNQVDYALRYLKKGIAVIPCDGKKQPLVKKWRPYQKRLPSEAEVRQWWANHPRANIAALTGPLSNLTVVDADSPEAWELLQEYIPDNFRAAVQITPSNNRQIFFRHKPGLHSENGIMDDIDLKTDGGYVLVPPSSCEYTKSGKHIVGCHRWENGGLDSGLPDMPDMLADELEKRQVYLGGKPGAAKAEDLYGPVEPGKRHQALLRLVGRWIYQKLDDPTISLAVRGWWESLEVKEGFTLDEAERHVAKILARYRKPGEGAVTEPPDLAPAILDSADFLSKTMPEKTVYLDPWLTAMQIVS